MKIGQNEFTSDHSIYSSYVSRVSINHVCELRVSTNYQFPFKGGGKNDHEFPFAGDVELLKNDLK